MATATQGQPTLEEVDRKSRLRIDRAQAALDRVCNDKSASADQRVEAYCNVHMAIVDGWKAVLRVIKRTHPEVAKQLQADMRATLIKRAENFEA